MTIWNIQIIFIRVCTVCATWIFHMISFLHKYKKHITKTRISMHYKKITSILLFLIFDISISNKTVYLAFKK
jgi:hypothetical protein